MLLKFSTLDVLFCTLLYFVELESWVIFNTIQNEVPKTKATYNTQVLEPKIFFTTEIFFKQSYRSARCLLSVQIFLNMHTPGDQNIENRRCTITADLF